mgnify:CR=1 FL=1
MDEYIKELLTSKYPFQTFRYDAYDAITELVKFALEHGTGKT